jgi:ATP-dependent RNA helicase DeaD
MALKKESNSLGSDQEKSQNEDSSLLEFQNLDNKKEIESQQLEVSKGDDNENGFLDFGFNQSILNSLINKG